VRPFEECGGERFANLALACVHKEYPNKIAHNMAFAKLLVALLIDSLIYEGESFPPLGVSPHKPSACGGSRDCFLM
jgi:hypothetical protein